MKLKAEQHYSDVWCVYDDNSYDGPGSPIGWGKTRHAAIVDLFEASETLQSVLEAIHAATN